MATYTATGNAVGQPIDFDVVLPPLNQTLNDIDTQQNGVATFTVQNNGNVGAVVTWSNESVTGAATLTGVVAEDNNNPVTSGVTLAPAHVLTVDVNFQADAIAPGESETINVSIDINVAQE